MILIEICFVSKDITVDSFAIRILKPDELGAGNTIQVDTIFRSHWLTHQIAGTTVLGSNPSSRKRLSESLKKDKT